MRGESVDFHRLLAAAPWPLRFGYSAPKLGYLFAATQLLLESLDLLVVQASMRQIRQHQIRHAIVQKVTFRPV